MTLTVKHQCDLFGAPLRLDREKQMLVCSFCGINYDYEYFREQDVHGIVQDHFSFESDKRGVHLESYLDPRDPETT